MARRRSRGRSLYLEAIEERALLSAVVIRAHGALLLQAQDRAPAPGRPPAALIDLDHTTGHPDRARVTHDLAVKRASRRHHPKPVRIRHHPKPIRTHHHHKPRGHFEGGGLLQGNGTAPAGGRASGGVIIQPGGGGTSGGVVAQPGGSSSRPTSLLVGSYTGDYSARFVNSSTSVTQQIAGTIGFVIGQYDARTGEFSGSLTFTNVPGAGTMMEQIAGIFDGSHLYITGPENRDLNASGSINSAGAITLTDFGGFNSVGVFVWTNDGGTPPTVLHLT